MIEHPLNISQLKEKTIKGIKITSLAFLIVKISALIRQIILARILGPDDFGLMAFCLVVVGFLANSINFRIHDAVIQTAENEKDTLNVGFTVQFFMAIALVAVILIFSGKISHILNRPLMAIYLRVLSFRILAPAFILPQALLHRKFDYRSIRIPEVAESLVNSLVSVSLAIAGFGIWSLIWGVMSGWLVSVIIILIFAGGFPKICFDFVLLKKILKFGLPLYLAFFLNWIFWNGDDFIVGKLLGDKSLGYYWIAFYLAHHLIDLRYILSSISFPVFARLKNNKGQLARIFTEFTKSTAFIFFLISALFIPLARPTLALIFGEKWIPATIPFMIFIGLVSIRSIFGYSGEFLMSVARTRYMLIVSLLQVSVLLTLGPLATLRFGITGMAITILLATSLIMICLLIYVKKIIAVSYIRMLWKTVLIAFVVGLIAFLLNPLIINLVSLILVMISCAILYVFLFIILDKLYMKRLKSYLLAPFKI